jgi:hypothetical protein
MVPIGIMTCLVVAVFLFGALLFTDVVFFHNPGHSPNKAYLFDPLPFFGFIVAAFVAAGWGCFRLGKISMSNHVPDPTSPSVTPPADAGGAPSVAADH